jgi:hypothetical protein
MKIASANNKIGFCGFQKRAFESTLWVDLNNKVVNLEVMQFKLRPSVMSSGYAHLMSVKNIFMTATAPGEAN